MCHVCELNAQGDSLPLRERLYVDRHWRIAHGWSSLPGWLIVAARRHVESLHELEPEEAEPLGGLLRAASVALQEIVGCEKTYVMLFAEHPRYPHVHFHVVPRMAWFGELERSAAAFRFLNMPEDEQVPAPERDRLAAEIGASIVRHL